MPQKRGESIEPRCANRPPMPVDAHSTPPAPVLTLKLISLSSLSTPSSSRNRSKCGYVVRLNT